MNAVAHSPHKTAFSLVELSIVLVIIGLLVGGVLAGDSLIHASRLRSITTELSRYRAAAQAFHDKYGAIPGDMPNATSYWGGVSGPNTLCATGLPQSTVPTTLTCNGDGNGLIGWNSEQWAFWLQLSNAGMIEGAYSGTAVPGAWSQVGVDVPASKFDNRIYWGVLAGGADFHHSTSSNGTLGDTFMFAGVYGNNLYLSHSILTPLPVASPGVLTPTDTWNIDSKIDDGNPGTGKMIVLKFGVVGPCTTTDFVAPPGDNPSAYALDNSGITCNPLFLDAF